MNAHAHRQRMNFLSLKASMGAITPAERDELERLSRIRITEVTGGTVFIEPNPPLGLHGWKAQVQRSREARTLPAEDDSTAT